MVVTGDILFYLEKTKPAFMAGIVVNMNFVPMSNANSYGCADCRFVWVKKVD